MGRRRFVWWAVDQPIPIHPRVDIPSPCIQCNLRVVRWPTKGRRTGCRLVCPARHGILPDDISSSCLGQTGPAARSMSALLQVCRPTCNLATWAPTRSRRRPASASCQCQQPIDCYCYYYCQASKRIESTMASHPNQAIRAPAAAAS